MAEFPLSAPQRKQLIQYLSRYVETMADRQEFLANAGLRQVMRSRIQLEGKSLHFAAALVDECQDIGTLQSTGEPALVFALVELKDVAGGQEDVIKFIDSLFTQSSTQSETSKRSEEVLFDSFNQALDFRRNKDWQRSLDIFIELQRQEFDPLGNLQSLIAETKEQQSKIILYEQMRRAYDMVVRIMREYDIEETRSAWNAFIKKYPEFHPDEDTEMIEKRLKALGPYLESLTAEQEKLLEVMLNGSKPIERVKAGRMLAEIGDPRAEVIDIDKMHFCWVPAGRFWMGSTEEDFLSYEDERPTDWYIIDYDFFIGRFPITNSHFSIFMDDNGYREKRWWNKAIQQGFWTKEGIKTYGDEEFRYAPHSYGSVHALPNHPIVGISWFEAIAFTEWLTVRWRKMGFIDDTELVTLPNEPEWEKSARGGEIIGTHLSIISPEKFSQPLFVRKIQNSLPKRKYPHGNNLESNKINFDQTNIAGTNPVGCFKDAASPYGCEEMSGNVWEWCRNIWESSYPYVISRDNLRGSNSQRVVRGGSYKDHQRNVRCACRGHGSPEVQSPTNGFRVVVTRQI